MPDFSKHTQFGLNLLETFQVYIFTQYIDLGGQWKSGLMDGPVGLLVV